MNRVGSLIPLPYVRIGKTQQDYTNLDQRNVHIWASDSLRGGSVFLVAGA